MAYIHGEKELANLLQHPLVQPLIDQNKFHGVAGNTLVDYALGVVEQAVGKYKQNNDLLAIELRERYQALRDLNPHRYSTHSIHPPSESKKPSYSARRCTEPIDPLS